MGSDMDERSLSFASPARTDSTSTGLEPPRLRLAEEERFFARAVFAATIARFDEPMVMIDADRRLLRMNDAARKRFGIPGSRDVTGKLCHEEFFGREAPCAACPAARCSDARFFEREVEPGSGRMERVEVEAVRRQSGEIGAFVIRITDSARRTHDEKRLASYEKLASLGMLVASVAHEINNVNSFIYFNAPILRTYVQFLLPIVDEKMAGDPEQRVFGRPYREFRQDCLKIIDNIEHGSTRSNQILCKLREFARDRAELEKGRVELKKAVENGVSLCVGRIRRSVKHFRVEIPEGLPPVAGDQVAIEQVVVNLLINAAQAADKVDSRVELTVMAPVEPAGRVALEVRDNGCGFEPASRDRIFEPFFTTKAGDSGTGLGLSISHRLLTEMGGTIDIRSETGKGSAVRVEFCQATAKPGRQEGG